MSWPAAVALASALTNGAIGALAVARGGGRRLYRSFAVLSFTFAFWSLAYAWACPDFSDPARMKVLFTPLSWLPGAALSFVWVYTGLEGASRRRRTAPVYAGGLVFLALLWAGKLSLNQYRMAFAALGWPVIAVAAGWLIVFWLRAPDPEERNRRAYLALASIIGAAGAITDFMPAAGITVLPMANVSLMAYSLLVLAAIGRHDLLDLGPAAGRSLALIGAALSMAAFLAAFSWLTQRLEGPLLLNFFALSLALLAVLPPLWTWASGTARRALFERQAKVEAALEELGRAVEARGAASLDLRSLSEAAAACVRSAFGAASRTVWCRAVRGLEPVPAMPEQVRLALAGRPEVWTASRLRAGPLLSDPGPDSSEDAARARRALLEALEAEAAAAVAPVMRQGELVGAVLLGRPEAGFYDRAALRWLRRLALLLGSAVRSAELAAETLHQDRLAQLGSLAAGVAHEVRNPLSAILGAVELLRRLAAAGAPPAMARCDAPAVRAGGSPSAAESDAPEVRDPAADYLDIISDEVRRLDSTLTDLLDYASPGPRLARCSWAQVWDRTGRLLRPDLPCPPEVHAPAGPVDLAVSAGHLQQILINLLRNAGRAVSAGPAPRSPEREAGPEAEASAGAAPAKPCIKVSVRPREGWASIEVEDNGPGIPDEVLPRLFTPFATASAGGTGMGLATVRRLAALYGGRAWAENLARGARFVVELPLSRPEQGLVKE